MKLLLALQHWEGDKAQAEYLARFIADLEDEPRTDGVEFAMVARHDSSVDEATLNYVRKKMPAHGYRIPSGRTGYPGGCNSLWRGTLLFAAAQGFDYVLTFEADCTPMSRGWIDDLIAGVKSALETNPLAVVIGAMQPPWPGHGGTHGKHVNGNCVFRITPALRRMVERYQPSSQHPWDLRLFPEFEQLGGAVNTPTVVSEWRSNLFFSGDHSRHLAAGVALHHGVRDGTLLNLTRRHESMYDGLPYSGEYRVGGRWAYPDQVPSVEDQVEALGGTVEETLPATMLDGDLNGNWAEVSSSLRAFRVHRKNGYAIIRVEWGAARGEIVADAQQSVEDPRVVMDPVNPRAAHIFAAVYLDYRPKSRRCVQRHYRVFLSPDGARLHWEVVKDSTAGTQPEEKNWGYFYDKGQLRALYSIFPEWKVVEPEGGRVGPTPLPQSVRERLEEWSKKYGTPRGSATPIPIDGGRRWLSLFHSHTLHPDFFRRYYVGALVMSDRRNSYRCLDVSSEPFLTGSARSGFAHSLKEISWTAAAVFPCSLRLEGSNAIIAAGVNEAYSARITLPADVLSRKFSG